MAASTNDREDMNIKRLPEGHVFDHTFFLCPLSGRLPLDITREYNTRCRHNKTKWRFQILFKREGVDGPLSCSVDLKRTDDINKPMRVSLWVCCTISHDNLFEPAYFTNDAMMPSTVIEGNMSEAITDEKEIERILNQRILFQSSLSVELCHPKPKETYGVCGMPKRRLPDIFFSKM